VRWRRMRLGAAALGISTLLLGAPAASAFIVFQGSDYAQTFDNRRGIRVCDNEVDGHSAYTNYYRSIDSDHRRVEDSSGGSDFDCAASGESGNLIWKARVCENIPVYPDSCGGWVEH
jgi:hypothetical protein